MTTDLSSITDMFGNVGARLGLSVGLTGLGPIFGIRVHEQWQIDRGRPVLAGRDVYGHPLDINVIRHHGDPHAQLDGARDLLVGRALDKLDAMEAVLDDMGWEDRRIITEGLASSARDGTWTGWVFP